MGGDELYLILVGEWNTVKPGPPHLGGGEKEYQAGQIAYGLDFEADLLAQMAIYAPELAAGLSWGPYTMNDECLILTITPEPGTLVMLISGGLGLLFIVWRRRRRSLFRDGLKQGAPGLGRLPPFPCAAAPPEDE